MLPLPENRFKGKASTTKDTKVHEGKDTSSFLREASCPSWFNDFIRVRVSSDRMEECAYEVVRPPLRRSRIVFTNCWFSSGFPMLTRIAVGAPHCSSGCTIIP